LFRTHKLKKKYSLRINFLWLILQNDCNKLSFIITGRYFIFYLKLKEFISDRVEYMSTLNKLEVIYWNWFHRKRHKILNFILKMKKKKKELEGQQTK
jgi:hypothetical protein